MRRFVNRDEEICFLNNEYGKEESSFVVIYGRRRVGKTALIKEFVKDKNYFYFLSTEESESQNLKSFQTLAFEKFNVNMLRIENKLTWESIFAIIVNNLPRKKFIIAIDEFQYLTASNDAFSSVVQRIWDEMLKNKNVMLILCGSILSLMYKEVLSYSSPLYGRRTGQIRLKPIPFRYYREFYPSNIDDIELVPFYSLTGGIPKYVELIDFSKDLFKIIEESILKRTSFLFEEPFFLLGKEIKEIGSYFAILRTIASGKHKIGEIASTLEVKQTWLSYYINSLIEMDIIERIVPVTDERPEKSKKGLYFIKDYFLRFWFRFIYPYMSYLEIGDRKFVLENIKSYYIEQHVSFVYEELCREKTKEICLEGYFPFELERIGKWWEDDKEIDIVGIKDKLPILFGECKYKQSLTDSDTYYNLVEKSKKINKDASSYYVIFSKSGFTKSLIEIAEKDSRLLLIKGLDKKVL